MLIDKGIGAAIKKLFDEIREDLVKNGQEDLAEALKLKHVAGALYINMLTKTDINLRMVAYLAAVWEEVRNLAVRMMGPNAGISPGLNEALADFFMTFYNPPALHERIMRTDWDENKELSDRIHAEFTVEHTEAMIWMLENRDVLFVLGNIGKVLDLWDHAVLLAEIHSDIDRREVVGTVDVADLVAFMNHRRAVLGGHLRQTH